MPTWTISAKKEDIDSMKETAKNLGLSYAEYFRTMHRAFLKTLTSKDFERAKKLVELRESKERLSSLREYERILLREKGYKNKNVQRILEDIDDPEIKKEVLLLSKLREEEANKQLKIIDELNPIEEKPKKKRKHSKEWYLKKAKELGLRKKKAEPKAKKRKKERSKRKKKRLEAERRRRERKEREWLKKLKKNPKFGLSIEQIKYVQDFAEDEGISFLEAREQLGMM
jgi:hypothetical protein